MTTPREAIAAGYQAELAAEERAKLEAAEAAAPPPAPVVEEKKPEEGELSLHSPEAAAFAVETFDALFCNLVDKRLALDAEQKARITEKLVPVLKKWAPALSVSPEWALAGTVAMAYGGNALKHGVIPNPFAETAPSSSAAPATETKAESSSETAPPAPADVVQFPNAGGAA